MASRDLVACASVRAGRALADKTAGFEHVDDVDRVMIRLSPCATVRSAGDARSRVISDKLAQFV
jgi:hypothetical protein